MHITSLTARPETSEILRANPVVAVLRARHYWVGPQDLGCLGPGGEGSDIHGIYCLKVVC